MEGNNSIVIVLALVLVVVVCLLLFSRRKIDTAALQRQLSDAHIARQRGDHEQAEILYRRAIETIDSVSDKDESLLCAALNGRAESLERIGKRPEAEQLRARMVSIFQDAIEKRRDDFLMDIDYLCTNAEFGSSTSEVANFYEKLLAYREKTVPQTSDVFINTVSIYSRLLRTLGENSMADELDAHAVKLRQGGKGV
ncbi:tetratricopeptide repeat protein [Candidatus Obscuribacterales bacterium]|nr:tetratricopeptide repeat protein [Candidatus Obscuribacterales bacterium]